NGFVFFGASNAQYSRCKANNNTCNGTLPVGAVTFGAKGFVLVECDDVLFQDCIALGQTINTPNATSLIPARGFSLEGVFNSKLDHCIGSENFAPVPF